MLADLADAYFRAYCTAHPFSATVSGVPGYDAVVPDPSRAADDAYRRRLAGFAAELAALAEPAGPDRDAPAGAEDRISYAMLDRLLRDEQATLAAGLQEVAVTAAIGGALSGVVAIVPAVSLTDPPAAEAYLARLRGLGGYFDALAARHRDAAADGRYPTARGVRQAIAQLEGYLATPPDRDPLLRAVPATWQPRAAAVVVDELRPALVRYGAALADLLPVGRPDERVGICHVPGGAEGYRALVRAHTTTELTPDEIHETGRRLVATLRDEFAERGGRALGTGDASAVLVRLREDPALRFGEARAIVTMVDGALRRAEAALPDWFRGYRIAPCVVREMDPVEAENAVLGYYLPPAADGSRPGAHVVNTHRPQLRARYEYETLAFHESVPGHHLQFAVAQSLTALPDFRRFAYVTAHSEGWGLYVERLCDEMGLYSGELSRLGMVSFDAWRACRLVVDTGLHHHGWSRERAIDYLRANTALSDTNIANEVDRYIASPGQALAYMIGRLRIRELRDRARSAGDFDIREFHHQLLAHGSLPLDTLDELFR